MRAAIAAVVISLAAATARADAPDGLALVEHLGAGDRAAVAAAVHDIEAAPAGTPYLADALFAAGRACEDTLADPARALALYERIERELPDAGVVIAARRRADQLRARIGAGGAHAREAGELAQLIADADRLAPAEVEQRAEALAAAAWPGASEAALWHAQWLRRSGRLADAQRRYALVVERWPGTPYAIAAVRDGAGNALAMHDWDLAAELAGRLPTAEQADQILRDELLAAAARGRARARWYVIAWIAVIAALAALAGSLAEAALRGGRRRPRVPIEAVYLAPVAAVLIGVALTTHQAIAPAVTVLSLGGLVAAGLSGAALDLLRARGRPVRARALVHIALSVTAVASLLYIVLMRDNLLDIIIETVRFGPE